MNYKLLVPPKNKLIEYESRLDRAGNGLIYMIRILDFDEDNEFSGLLSKYSEKDADGKLKEDDNGMLIVNNDDYYADMFTLLVPEIKGLEIPEGKDKVDFSPPWRIIKEVVNEGRKLNTFIDLEK